MTTTTQAQPNEIQNIITEVGLEKTTSNKIENCFMPFLQKIQEWEDKAISLVVTDVAQTREMKMAREARLALRDIRIDADNTRKALKEDSLRYAKAVQGVYNLIEYKIAPIEKHLLNQEKFAEIQEEKRRAELKIQRESELLPYAEFVPFGLDFANMSEEDFIKTLNGAKLQHQNKIDTEKRERELKEAREKAAQLHQQRKDQALPYWNYLPADLKTVDLSTLSGKDWKLIFDKAVSDKISHEKEVKRIADENRKLKEEADRKSKEAEQARLASEKKDRELQAAKRVADQLATKLKDQEAAAANKAKEDEEKKLTLEDKINALKNAPDVVKLLKYATDIEAVDFPLLADPKAQTIANNARQLLAKVSVYIKSNTKSLAS